MTRYELYWRNLWLCVVRSPRDARALKAVIWLLTVMAYFGYLIWTFSYLGWWGSVCWGGITGAAIGGAVLVAKNNAQWSKSLIQLSNHRVLVDPEFAEHREKLANSLRRSTVLVDRAGVEASHKGDHIPDKHRGICRRRTLDLAMKPGLWADFTPEERDLLVSLEGSWDWSTIIQRIGHMEDVRVLRWILQVDDILVPFEFLKHDLKPAVEITLKPALVEGRRCMPPWDLRPAKEMASLMVHRCIAEGLERGFFPAEEETIQAAYLELAESMGSGQSVDLVIGAKTVGEAPEESIRSMAQIALRRAQVLEQAIIYLGGAPGKEFRATIVSPEVDSNAS